MAIEPAETFDGLISQIRKLWDEKFAQHMKPESKEKFPKNLGLLSKHYHNKNYPAAHQIIKPMYDWASFGFDVCEGTGPDFAYCDMANLVGAVDDKVEELNAAA